MLKTASIQFYVNDHLIRLDSHSATKTLLQLLRQDLTLTGTKEGCAEGDCGACTVVVAGINAPNTLNYEAVNSCILPISLLDGKQIFTVEYLSERDSASHPVQQAFVKEHASQCGFCTPGFVMSSFALHQKRLHDSQIKDLTSKQVSDIFAGNLCRCTGYGTIISACKNACNTPYSNTVNETEIIDRLQNLKSESLKAYSNQNSIFVQPHSEEELIEQLSLHPNATIVAGATDIGLWITKQRKQIPALISTKSVESLRKIHFTGNRVKVFAAVTYSEFMEFIADKSDELYQYLLRHSSVQIRNQGTIIGNLGNGSPIGDMAPALIALEAKLTLMSFRGSREIQLQDYFIEYGRQDIQKSEFIQSVEFELPSKSTTFKTYKISKRHQQDISTVAASFLCDVTDGVITKFKAGFGGVAGTPTIATCLEESLVQQPVSASLFSHAANQLTQEFEPLSDHRGSKEYRRQVCRNLLIKFYIEHLKSIEKLKEA